MKGILAGFYLIAFAASAAGQAPAQAGALSLEECVKRALAQSPDLTIAQERLAEAEAQMKKTYAPFSPQASLTLNQTEFGYDELGQLNRGNQWNPATYNGGLALTWNLFNGGKDLDRYHGAKYDAQAGADNLAAARQSIILATIQAYYGVLSADRAIGAQSEDLNSKTEHYNQTKSMYHDGVRSYSDLLNAQIQAKVSEIQLTNLDSNREAALYSLNILLGLPVADATEVIDEFSFKPLKENLEDNLQTAYGQRPEMLAAQAEVNSAQAQESYADHDIIPTLTVGGTYNDTFAGIPYGTIGNVFYTQNPFWQVNIGVNFPIWDGGVRYQEIKRSSSAVRLAEDTLEQTKRAVQKDVASAYVEVERNQQVYQIASSQVDAAREDLKIITQRYKNGGASVLDVVDAQANLLRTQLDEINALYNFHIAVFRLKEAMGSVIL
jgi:outer membrane protein TolC